MRLTAHRATSIISLISLTGLAVIGTACSTSKTETTTVRVFAAASLTGSFTEIETAFEAANPSIDVVFNFAASSELATQISEGAPADVFASADTKNMDKVADVIDGDPVTFATNRLQIITEPGNPLGISGLADLADPAVLFVTSAPEVPIGTYTADVLARAGVDAKPVSLEESVKGIVTKVTTGEADAGIVYATDVIAAGSAASGVDIAEEFNVVVSYPVARLTSSDGAAKFIAYLSSDEGRRILGKFGFGAP